MCFGIKSLFLNYWTFLVFEAGNPYICNLPKCENTFDFYNPHESQKYVWKLKVLSQNIGFWVG